MKSTSVPFYKDIHMKILIHEKMYPELLEYCKNNIAQITEYYKHLLPDYKDEVAEIFLSYVKRTASQASDRRLYAGVCEIIKKYAKRAEIKMQRKLYWR